MANRKERVDAAMHRKLILETAQALFDEHGIERVTMHQIAKSAGIGQGTLYRRYSSKAELCLDLLYASFSSFKEDISAYLQSASSRPVQERVETVLTRVVDFMDKKSRWLTVIQRPAQADGEVKALYFHSPPYEFFHSIVRSLLEEGLNRRETIAMNPDLSAHMILSPLAPDLFLFLRDERGCSPDDIVQHMRMLYVEPLFSAPG